MADPILSKEAAARIWKAHREIDVGRELLLAMAETLEQGGDATPIDPSDRHRRGYSLGLPSGTGERILFVAPQLARLVIEAHIAAKQAELIEATAAAREELNAPKD